MKTITNAELEDRIEAHGEWLSGNAQGRRLELVGYNLNGSNLRWSKLRWSTIRGSDIRDSDIRDSDLREIDLRDSDLNGSDLRDSDLRGSNLRGSKTNYTTIGIETACPETGAFEAWKNCKGIIIQLLIPADAERSSATTRKCRANKALVLDVIGATQATSNRGMIYEKGCSVFADSWDPDRWNECSHGIHFFMNRGDAETW